MAGAVQVGALVINMAADVATLKTNLAEATRAAQTTGQRMADDLSAARKSIESAIAPLQHLTVKFGSLESQIQSAQASVMSLAKGLIIGSAAGLSIDAIKTKILGVVDSMAHLKEVSEKTGASVESLSKIGFIAKQSGSDIDSVAAAVVKLSKGMAGADADTKGAGLALSFLGLKAKDAAGNLKDPAQMFTEIAQKLGEYKDGAGKAAIAQALFGKAGAEMLPTLKLLGEQGDMVAKVTDAQATAARQYTRDMVKLEMQKGMLFKTIATSLLPTMTDFANAMLDASKNTSTLGKSVKGVADDGSITSWADSAAMGVARLVDVIMMIPRLLKAVSGSFQVVAADINVASTGAAMMNPVSYLKGGNPVADFNKAVAERNKTLEDSNKRYDELWNYDGAAMEKAMATRIAARAKDVASAQAADAARKAAEAGKPSLNFNTAGEDGEEAKKAAAELEKKKRLMAELTGVTGSYIEDLTRLQALRVQQNMSDERYVELVTQLIAKQPAAKKMMDEQAKSIEESNKRAAQGAADMAKIWKDYHDAAAKSVQDATNEAAKNEELVKTFSMSKSAIEAQTVARLEDQLAQRAATGMTLDEIDTLEKLIAAKKRNAAALATLDGLEEQKKMWQSVEQTAHDTFISIFDSGKSAFNRLRDALKNGLLDLLYQMTLKKWIFNIGASVTGSGGIAGAAQAAVTGGPGNAAGSMLGSAAGSGLGIAGTIGSIGTGAMQTAGAILSGEIGFGATLSAGLSAVGTGTASGLMAGMSSLVGALGPIALGIGAVVMLAKSLDHSGTYHTGGAASASSAGVSTIAAESLHFEKTQTSADAEKMTAQLASGIVGILDSTALAFGKTAGYTAATAFADDSSKDGAWGGLVISKLGQTLVDWQDSRGNGPWAPKVFADGAEGQKQYLAAISSDVRTALNGIGLPDWAQKMLDGLGKDAGIDEMAKVVDAINATQKALKVMGDTLSGFSGLSEGAVSALMAAAGGIQNLAAGASAYYDGFYSDYEKNASATKQVADALKAVGLEMPDTNAGFRALVEQQMALGEAAAPAQAALFGVAGAFAKLHPLIESTTTALENQAAAIKDAANLSLSGVDSAFSALQSVVAREKAVLQTRIDAETALVAKYKSLSDALHGALDAGSTMDRASAQAQIKTALTIAKAGGPLPAADSLKTALGVIGKDSQALFATYQDYQRDFYSTQNDIGDLAKLSDNALSVEEKSLKSLQDQSKALDNILIDAQEQINILKGISTNGLTLIQAVEGLRSAILGAMSNPVNAATSAVNTAYQSALGRAPDPGGLQFWQDKAASGVPLPDILGAIKNSPEAQIQGLYKSLFNRTADAGGLDFFMHSGASMSAIRDAMMGSDEYKRLHPFAVGTNFVPETMPALIHEGERIIPAADNRMLMARLSSPTGNSEALAAAVERLTATVDRQEKTISNLEAALDQTQRNTKRMADGLEVVTDGFNKMRT